MTSARETVMTALAARLATVSGLTVERNREVPIEGDDIPSPPGGAAVLYDPPEPDQVVEVIFSPARYVLEAVFDCEVTVEPQATGEATRAALDSLLALIGAALNDGDVTLGGAAEWIFAGPAQFAVARDEGSERFEVATVPIECQYLAANPLST